MADSEHRRQLERILTEHSPKALAGLAGERKKNILDAVDSLVQVTQTQITHRSGPLPPPEEMMQYNECIPNGADRILKLTELQTSHRISIEAKVIDSQQSQSNRGQKIAAFLVTALIVAGAWVTLKDHDAVGGIIFGTTICGVAALYITGKWEQKRDLQKKK